MSTEKQVFHSNIWEEEPESNNPFEAKACYCHGYDVYNDILGNATFDVTTVDINHSNLENLGDHNEKKCCMVV